MVKIAEIYNVGRRFSVENDNKESTQNIQINSHPYSENAEHDNEASWGKMRGWHKFVYKCDRTIQIFHDVT